MAEQSAFIDKISLWAGQAGDIAYGWLTTPAGWSQFAVLALAYLLARTLAPRLSLALDTGIEGLAVRLGRFGDLLRFAKRLLPLMLPLIAFGLAAAGEQATRAAFGAGEVIAFGSRVFIFLAVRRFARDILRDPFLRALARRVLVPNHHFFTTRVVNYSDLGCANRYEAPFSVDYDTDLSRVPEVVIAAREPLPFVLSTPEGPDVELVSFGESSVDFAVEYWVQGIDDGKNKYRSQVNFAIWNALKAAGIVMPYPHRVIEVKGAAFG
jgi:hypothetical protein